MGPYKPSVDLSPSLPHQHQAFRRATPNQPSARVVVGSSFGAHDGPSIPTPFHLAHSSLSWHEHSLTPLGLLYPIKDVYFSAVDTLNRVLPANNTQVYGRQPRYNLHTDILPALGVNPSGVYADTDDLLHGVTSGWGGGANGGATHVILGTCEIE